MAPKPINQNVLFYGDNLPILREYFSDESIDLVYLDPPFNSNRSYNVLFSDEGGQESEAQISAFDDTWHWDKSASRTYHEIIQNAPALVSDMIGALHSFIGENQMMAYLAMMTARLVELQRVLKPTGSLYLHCDPTASHYLKIITDTIFSFENFRSEISWKRSSAHSDAKQGRRLHGHIHDVILYYTKTEDYTWNTIYTPYDESYVTQFYRYTDPISGRRFRTDNLTGAKPGGDTRYLWRIKRPLHSVEWQADLENEYLSPQAGWEYKGMPPYHGRYWAYSLANMQEFARQDRIYYTAAGMPNYKRYFDEMPGVPLQDFWSDIPPALGNESLGYPTQKPSSLLERIIQASSNPGDVVLDPFCGCGTAIAAAQKLNRRWIGIDITYLAISLQKYRLKDAFNIIPGKDYQVIGEPVDLTSAKQLATDNRYQFQWWALGLIGAMPLGGEQGDKRGKKGKDLGVDGKINFIDDPSGIPKSVLVQVKSGHVKSGDIRDLHGTVDRENAPIGVFITLEQPTSDMNKEALSAGYYTSELWRKDYPKIQILTVDQIFHGEQVQMPPAHGTFKKAERVQKSEGSQSELGI